MPLRWPSEMHFAVKRPAAWSSTSEKRFSSTDSCLTSPVGSSSTCLDQRLTYLWKQSYGTQASPHRAQPPSPVLLQRGPENFGPSPFPSYSVVCQRICFGAFRKSARGTAST